MANEIQMSASLIVNKDGTSLNGTASKTVDMSGSAKIASTQNIGTTTEALSIGDVTDVGYVYIKNLDSTNYVEVGITSPVSASNAMITLKPGEFALFPTRLETIYAKANTAACNVDIVAGSL